MQLAPVRPGREGGERRLDERQHLPHSGRLVAPREVDREEVPLVRTAQPEVVRGSRAQLADEQVRTDGGGQRQDRREGGCGIRPRDEVLGLDLVAVGRGGVEAEVRQPHVPRPGHAALLGDVVAEHRRQRLAAGHGIAHRPGERVRHRVVVVVEAGLHPDVADGCRIPFREHRDAVARPGDRVGVGEERIPRQTAEDVLTDAVRGFDGEVERHDHTEGPDADGERGEVRVAGAHLARLAIRTDEPDAAHRGRQHAVAVSGAVRARARGTADGDVWERSEVVQRPAALVQPDREVAVPRPCGHRHGAGILVEREPADEPAHVDQRARGVGEVRERVARSERVHGARALKQPAHVVDIAGRLDPRSPVLVGPRPVARHVCSSLDPTTRTFLSPSTTYLPRQRPG